MEGVVCCGLGDGNQGKISVTNLRPHCNDICLLELENNF